MAREIFLDTGFWVAFLDLKDPYYARASSFYPRLLSDWPTWVTTSFVVSETYTLLHRRGGYPIATHFLTILQSSFRLVRVSPTFEIEMQAEEILQRYKDQDFSYVDAISFAVMRERNLTQVFTFDHHFSTAGFTQVS